LPEERDAVDLAGLLRKRGDRPGRRTGEQRNKVASSHWSTLSARGSGDGAFVGPRTSVARCSI
jgi:hypothetical protein